MSKRHQSSRRRTYGRRQHELRERTDRAAEATFDDSLEEVLERRPSGAVFGRFDLGLAGPGLVFLGVD